MPLLLAALGFFSGSILYSALFPRVFKGIDIRKMADDGNPGAANAFQYGGKLLGSVSLICDLLKAYLPVRLSLFLITPLTPGFGLVLCAPVLGHAFSPFAHGKGGKAIAASFGVLLALLPDSRVVCHLAFWYILFSSLILIRPHAIRTILSFMLTALYAVCRCVPSIAIGTVLVALTVSWRHLPSLHSDPFTLHFLGFRIVPRHRQDSLSTH